MANYIYSVFGKIVEDAYIVDVELSLPLHSSPILQVQATIDTGCMRSVLSYQSLIGKRKGIKTKQFIKDVSMEALRCKQVALDSNLRMYQGYGVNDTDEFMAEENERINKGNYLECTTLSFIHPIEGIKIAEYNFKIRLVSSYNL